MSVLFKYIIFFFITFYLMSFNVLFIIYRYQLQVNVLDLKPWL